MSANGVVKRRMTWKDVEPFPDNPIYEGRLRQMEAQWGGYDHSGIGSPAIFDNSAKAFPEYGEDVLFIGDGNHRRALAARHRKLNEEFLADLHRGLSNAEMYRRRRQLNDRRTVKPAETFLALCAEAKGRGARCAIKQTVEGLGWQITYDRAKRGLSCTNELEWIWARSNSAMVRTIQTWEQVWGDEPDRAQARVIKGIGAFWVKYPDADVDRLLRSLENVKPGELYISGKTQANTAPFIKSVYDGIRYTLAMGYNRKGRKGTLPL